MSKMSAQNVVDMFAGKLAGDCVLTMMKLGELTSRSPTTPKNRSVGMSCLNFTT